MVTRRGFRALLMCWLVLCCPLGAARAAYGEDSPGAITETVVMLYYRDVSAALDFYGRVLGLKPVFSSASATLFRLTERSALGVVEEGPDAYHRARRDNAVMLSIVTPDVDGWYQALRQKDAVDFLKPLEDSSSAPVRAFLIRDPGGYTVEFFSWRSRGDSTANHRTSSGAKSPAP